MAHETEPSRLVQFDMPDEQLDGLMQIREISPQETLGSLVRLACSEYVEKRKAEPGFEDEVAAARERLRQEIAVAEQA